MKYYLIGVFFLAAAMPAAAQSWCSGGTCGITGNLTVSGTSSLTGN